MMIFCKNILQSHNQNIGVDTIYQSYSDFLSFTCLFCTAHKYTIFQIFIDNLITNGLQALFNNYWIYGSFSYMFS